MSMHSVMQSIIAMLVFIGSDVLIFAITPNTFVPQGIFTLGHLLLQFLA